VSGEPSIERVEEVFDDRTELDGDLGMVLTGDFSPANLVSDRLEHRREGYPLQPGDMGWGSVRRLDDDAGHGVGQAVGHLEAETSDFGADRGQIAQAASGLVGQGGADLIEARQRRASESRCRAGAMRPGPDELREGFKELLLSVEDQALLGREVVVDSLFGHLRGLRHVEDGHMLVAPLSEKGRRSFCDELAGLTLLALTQANSGAGGLIPRYICILP